jgi:TMEM175 potassium channel family protein
VRSCALHKLPRVTERALGRIGAFTDGVMAVAITLLVLNIEVPTLKHGQSLGDALVDLLPSLGAYVLAFALVGRFWVIHHNLFEKLRDFDSRLMFLNLAFLALIVLIPFSAELYDTYTSEALAAAVLGANLGLAALAHWAMTVHVVRSGFVDEERRAETAPSIGLGITTVFLASVPAAFLSVHIAEALWISTVVVRYPLRRMGRRTTSP